MGDQLLVRTETQRLASETTKPDQEEQQTWDEQSRRAAEQLTFSQTTCRFVGHAWIKLASRGPAVCGRCGVTLQ